MNTSKIKTRTSLFHTVTYQHYNKVLSQDKVLQTLSTEIYIIKDLIINRLLQKDRGKLSDVSFNLTADMSRAVRMSSPESCDHNDNSQHLGCLSQYLCRKQERTQINSIRGMAACGIRTGMLHTNYYCYVTPRPQRIPNAEWTEAWRQNSLQFSDPLPLPPSSFLYFSTNTHSN